jgi:hypothetical protein
MKTYPNNMQINRQDVELQTAVPTFHIRAHGPLQYVNNPLRWHSCYTLRTLLERRLKRDGLI